MRWLLERGEPIERFHQAVLLQVPAALQEDQLAAALQAVLDHHDALRLRIATGWRADRRFEITPVGTVDGGSLPASC